MTVDDGTGASPSGDAASKVTVVRTGTANLASVCAGLRRAGVAAELTDDVAAVESAERLVLPGVGAFGAAMAQLEARGLVEVLRERVRLGRPLLAVCVGLQVLCEGSDESPGVGGLAVVKGRAQRFRGPVRVPQLGWNEVIPEPGCTLLRQPGYGYFANSYHLAEAPEGWHAAFADHGGRFVAAFERGAQLCCQFHPELSGSFGAALLARWLEAGRSPGGGRPC